MTEDTTGTATAIGRFRLEIISGPLKGTFYPILDKKVTVGRSLEADICIDDILISRQQCILTFSGGHWFIEDAGSTNGTWLVGQKLKSRALLPINTPVRIGKTMFEIFDLTRDKTEFTGRDWRILLKLSGDQIVDEMDSPEAYDFGGTGGVTRLLDGLYHFQNTIAGVQDEQKLHPKMLSSLCRIMPDYDVYSLTYDIEKSQFAIKASRNAAGSLKNPSIQDLNLDLVDYVKETRESAVFQSEQEKCVIILPMRGKQQLNGIFYLSGLASRMRTLSGEELRMLSVIGYIAGMAVEHNRVIEVNVKNRLPVRGKAGLELSHYIQNIITGLDGCVNLLRLGMDENDRKLSDEAWGLMNKNQRRLSGVALDLFTLVNEYAPEMEVQDIPALLREACSAGFDALAAENIHLEVAEELCSADVPLMAEIDAPGIQRVLQNLILNAEYSILCRRTRPDDREPKGLIRLFCTLSRTRTELTVSVKDNGVGISPKVLRKLFNLSLPAGSTPGIGLGLAVCKKIVEAHGGRISAESDPGRGSIFSFCLPVTCRNGDTSTRSIKRFE